MVHSHCCKLGLAVGWGSARATGQSSLVLHRVAAPTDWASHLGGWIPSGSVPRAKVKAEALSAHLAIYSMSLVSHFIGRRIQPVQIQWGGKRPITDRRICSHL